MIKKCKMFSETFSCQVYRMYVFTNPCQVRSHSSDCWANRKVRHSHPGLPAAAEGTHASPGKVTVLYLGSCEYWLNFVPRIIAVNVGLDHVKDRWAFQNKDGSEHKEVG